MTKVEAADLDAAVAEVVEIYRANEEHNASLFSFVNEQAMRQLELSGPSASGRLLASWAAPMELEQSAFVKRAQETARTADYTEVQIDE